METSRIFVKGLPPTFTEAEFRKHFSQKHPITDAKFFQPRRIGYVGYQSTKDAQSAVKYFNRTFIRMSRIGVELARPVQDARSPAPSKTAAAPAEQNGLIPQHDAGARKRKREEEQNPELKEFLAVMKPKSQRKAAEIEMTDGEPEPGLPMQSQVPVEEEGSDDEYQIISKKARHITPPEEIESDEHAVPPEIFPTSNATKTDDGSSPKEDINPPVDTDANEIRTTMRLFLRNLSFGVKDEDLESEFLPFGHLEEVHVPQDPKTGTGKGIAFVQFSDPDSAERAWSERDGTIFQGRLLHILPARAKQTTKLDDFELSKLPFHKQQMIKKRRELMAARFNWNALYLNADAVVSNVADRLGLAKSEMLDPTNSKAAVQQAHAETHVIQEAKGYFSQHGVDVNAFKRKQQSDTAILIRNIPSDGKDEIRRRLEEYGDLKRFLIPPSGIIAIVEFANAAQCNAAYQGVSRKINSSTLLLSKAPKELFTGGAPALASNGSASVTNAVTKTSASDLKDSDLAVPETAGIATLYVRNLNFTTTTGDLVNAFRPLDGFLSARVKTKTDPKKPGQILSMGFGFLEFRSSSQAQAALHTMDGHILAGHKLQIRASDKGVDAAEQRRRADAAKTMAGQRTKVIIKNLPFEVTKKDVRALFGAYGQLRSVRLPTKMGGNTRGFAFADFTTPKEAESAVEALTDTHFLGRRLVLEFAEAETVDAEAEIQKMQQKVGAQVNKVALQNLTSGGRKKFSTAKDDTDD